MSRDDEEEDPQTRHERLVREGVRPGRSPSYMSGPPGPSSSAAGMYERRERDEHEDPQTRHARLVREGARPGASPSYMHGPPSGSGTGHSYSHAEAPAHHSAVSRAVQPVAHQGTPHDEHHARAHAGTQHAPTTGGSMGGKTKHDPRNGRFIGK